MTEKQREILERASGKIESLATMASELLDLARIESGLIAQEKETLDVAALLTDQVSFHQPGAREKDIRIDLEALPDLPPVLANRRNMEEVMDGFDDFST